RARSQDEISLMQGQRFPGTIWVPLLQMHGSTRKQDQGNVGCGGPHPALQLHRLVESLHDQVFPACFLAGEVEKRRGQRAARPALRCLSRNHHRSSTTYFTTVGISFYLMSIRWIPAWFHVFSPLISLGL